MESKKGQKPYQVNDIALVSYLQTIGYKQIKDPTVVGHNVHYLYNDTAELRKEIEDFYNHRAKVDPLSLLETFRTIKTTTMELKKLGGVWGGGRDE
jgi:hypothetical protein